MNNINKRELLKEAEMQTKALSQIKKWLRLAMTSSTLFFGMAYWGITGSGVRFFSGIIGIILLIISVIVCIIINVGLKNGRKNVEKILQSIE